MTRPQPLSQNDVAFRQVNAGRTDMRRQRRVQPDQQHQAATTGDLRQPFGHDERARMTEMAVDHARTGWQAFGDVRWIGRADGVGDEPDHRQALSPLAQAL